MMGEQDKTPMDEERDMLQEGTGGSSPGDEDVATDPQKTMQPYPTPGEEHLSPVEDIEERERS